MGGAPPGPGPKSSQPWPKSWTFRLYAANSALPEKIERSFFKKRRPFFKKKILYPGFFMWTVLPGAIRVRRELASCSMTPVGAGGFRNAGTWE